jgi:hypothetical protein
MHADANDSGGQPQEDEQQRIDRELIELLNELRVALPGVQVLFAFLLTVPFAQGFAQATAFQRDLFFAVLTATAVSAILLIAPSAWHRLRFRQQDKARIMFVSNKMAIVGLGFLGLAMIGAVMLIANYVFSDALTIVSGIVATLLLAVFWYALPLSGAGKESA